MSPAEARDALARAFPGMEWRSFGGMVRGDRKGAHLTVEYDESAWLATCDPGRGSSASFDGPIDAARQAISNARAHLTTQIAALDAVTEKP